MAVRDEKGKFVKGTSGNPSGRPVSDVSITKNIIKKLEEGNNLEEITDKIIELAKNGNEQIIKFLWDRIDGKLKETIDLNAQVSNFADWVRKTKEEENEQVKDDR